jgi:hypothetical protein
MASLDHELGIGLGEDLEEELGAYESEDESVFEDEMSGLGLGEISYEDELDGSFEDEMWGEDQEGDFFFKKMFSGIGKFVKKAAPILKKVAKVAAPMVGTAIGGPFGAAIGKAASSLLETDLEDEADQELDQEVDMEEESEPLTDNEVLAEYLGAVAAESDNEMLAETMAGASAMATLTARDRASLSSVIPSMMKGVSVLQKIVRQPGRSNPSLRPAARVVPNIVRRSVKVLRKKQAMGQPITKKTAARVMARQTAKVLSNPTRCAHAIAKNVKGQRTAATRSARKAKAAGAR